MHIGIVQVYCGASGKAGAYNSQEIGLAKALAALGHTVTVYFPGVDSPKTTTEETAPGVTVRTLPARRLSVHGFYKSLQPLADDGIQAVCLLADNVLGAPAVFRFCRKHHLPVCSYNGALYSDNANAAVRWVLNLLAGRNVAWFKRTPTFAKTPAIAAALTAAGVPGVQVAPVGLDLSIIPPCTETQAALRRRLSLPAEAPLLLFVGRLDPYKRPLDCLPLLAALPEAHLVMIGQGALRDELLRRVDTEELRDRFTYIQSLPNAQVQNYYHACDVFINCNDHEIFGMSILEAMYAGCPVVARHAPGPDLILATPGTGVLVDSEADLPAGVRAALADPAMGENAHREILARFQWTSTARQLLDAWKSTDAG